MSKLTPARAVPYIVALAFCASSAPANTVTGMTSPDPTAIIDPCPNYTGYSCLTTAYEAQVLQAGANEVFETAWNMVLPREWDPTLWSLQFSTEPLDITLDAQPVPEPQGVLILVSGTGWLLAMAQRRRAV